MTWKQKDVKEYWDHWEKFGQVHHPAMEQKKHIPVGMAGDDAKYTLAGAKIIVMLLNFPLQEVLRFMAEYIYIYMLFDFVAQILDCLNFMCASPPKQKHLI